MTPRLAASQSWGSGWAAAAAARQAHRSTPEISGMTILRNGRRAGNGDGALAAVRAALDDDLDTVTAIEAVDAAVAAGEGVAEAAKLLKEFETAAVYRLDNK